MQFRSRLLAVMVAALLAGSACSSEGDEPAVTTTAPTDASSTSSASSGGSGDATPDEQAYVEAMEQSLRPSGGAPMSEEQATCLAPRLVEILDPERLAEAGVAPDELHTAAGLDVPGIDVDEDDANEMYDSYGECGIDMRSIFLDGVLAGSGLDTDQVECVESVVTDDKIRALMVGMTLVGEDAVDDIPEVAAFGEELEACTAGATP